MKLWLTKHRTLLINLFVLGGLAYLVIPHLDEFKVSIQSLSSADPAWILFAIVVYFLGMPLMAMQLDAIALKPLQFFTTYKVQMAALFVNRVVPSGLGLLLMNSYYLKKYGHSSTQTASVISVSALTSSIAFGMIIILGLVVGQGSEVVKNASFSIPSWLLWVVLAAVIVMSGLLLFSATLRNKIKKPFLDIMNQLAGYRHRPKDIVIAILGNGGATMTSVITLFACAQSLGTPISITLALITYVLGNTLGGLVPTPGGLGGVEAGLYAGLVLGGTDAAAALSIVLLYRLITYWLALGVGIVFFLWLRKDVLSTFSFKKPA